jgi:hypothetical protein
MKNQIFILTLLVLMLATAPVSATIDITPTNVTSSSIMWGWSPVTIQNLSIDGVFVCNVNPASTSFTLSDLGPNEPHTINIITAGNSGENTTYTLGDTNVNQSTDFLTLLTTWWYLVLILILCVVGMMRRLGIFLIVASCVSLYALYEFITLNPNPGTSPLVQIPFLIYVVFFIIPIWLCFGVKKGVFK